jgi:hypothetical protein
MRKAITNSTTTTYGLVDQENDSVLVDPYWISSDSLFWWGDYSQVIDTLEFWNEDEKIVLKKSDYDRPNSADEESYVYWNNEYGVVALYNYAGGVLVLYTVESIEDFMKNELYRYIIMNE